MDKTKIVLTCDNCYYYSEHCICKIHLKAVYTCVHACVHLYVCVDMKLKSLCRDSIGANVVVAGN